ncbi:hypothetical protein [Kosakonia cowanii]|uniref:hypothetical protein n=1 Tax=Kosakonia cowanii TaxID=208223 RepID=UPI003D24FBE4
MRKPQQSYDLEIPDDDYKTAAVMMRDKANFESPYKWVYVGADARSPWDAKIGITMDDLRSRSYSTGNAEYYLFCAFQCDQRITKQQLEDIERSAIAYLDRVFVDDNGITKRKPHWESQRLSEWYYGINFEEFFVHVHNFLYDNYGTSFQIGAYLNEVGEMDGQALAWLFNPQLEPGVSERYLRMILRY